MVETTEGDFRIHQIWGAGRKDEMIVFDFLPLLSLSDRYAGILMVSSV